LRAKKRENSNLLLSTISISDEKEEIMFPNTFSYGKSFETPPLEEKSQETS